MIKMKRMFGFAWLILFWGGSVLAESITYEITVTNLTRAQQFTPLLAAAHMEGVHLFALGTPASEELATLAEGGDTAPLSALLSANASVGATVSTADLTAAGASTTFQLTTDAAFKYVSLAAMMIPTNDGFIALDNVPLPRGNRQGVFYSPGFDAGSEPNDEICANIPGPDCGGLGASPGESGEGFVHIHAGIHGIGNLDAATYDWRNPVARVVIRRVK